MVETHKTVLLVEDEAIVALVERRQLEKIGYTVHHVFNGEQAIELIAKSEIKPDIVLMDIDLGRGIDGTVTAQRILQHRDLPIVFLSSHTEPEIVEKTEKITSYGYVVKNSGITVLSTSIKMAFRLFEAKKRAEEHRKSLFLSEEKHRLLLLNSPDIIMLQSRTKNLEYISPKGEKVLGLSLEEISTINIFDYVHPDDCEKVREANKHAFEEHEVLNLVYRFIRKDGQIRWLDHTARPFVVDGEFRGVQSTVRDITEQKQVEEKLKLQSLVLDQIMDHVTVTDLEGRITYVNRAELNTMNRSMEDLIGSSTAVYGEDASRGVTQQEIVENTLKNGTWRGEVVNYAEDGSEHIMDFRTQVVKDERGNPIALSGIATDVTDQIRIRKELQKSQLLYRSLFDQSPYGIVIIDPDSGGFSDFNDQVCRQLGYTRQEFAGLKVFDLEQKETEAETRAHFEKILKTGYDHFETLQKTKDGRNRLVEVTAKIINIDSSKIYHCIWRDLGAR